MRHRPPILELQAPALPESATLMPLPVPTATVIDLREQAQAAYMQGRSPESIYRSLVKQNPGLSREDVAQWCLEKQLALRFQGENPFDDQTQLQEHVRRVVNLSAAALEKLEEPKERLMGVNLHLKSLQTCMRILGKDVIRIRHEDPALAGGSRAYSFEWKKTYDDAEYVKPPPKTVEIEESA